MKKSISAGFTLIELLIALLIGSILLLGIATIFINTTNNIRLQRGIANIQDTGRLVADIMSGEIAGAGNQYCSSVNMQLATDGFVPQRSITNFFVAPGITVTGSNELLATYPTTARAATGGTFYGLPGIGDIQDASPTSVATWGGYRINPRFFIQGHDCNAGACTPALTVLGAGRLANGTPAAPAAAGAAVGQRVPNSDVLTIRTLVGNGASIVAGSANVFTLATSAPGPGALPRLGLEPAGRLVNRMMMIADCDKASIYLGSVNAAGTTLTLSPSNIPNSMTFGPDNNARVFDMENQWLTVTYYLRNIADPNVAARVIPTLMRQENGRQPEELARGVERLDFRYAVGRDANMSWMTAAEINAGAGVSCPPATKDAWENNCRWRDVTAVEVGYLVNTIDDVSNPETTQTYTMEGVVAGPATGRTIRREFRFVVPLRAWVQ